MFFYLKKISFFLALHHYAQYIYYISCGTQQCPGTLIKMRSQICSCQMQMERHVVKCAVRSVVLFVFLQQGSNQPNQAPLCTFDNMLSIYIWQQRIRLPILISTAGRINQNPWSYMGKKDKIIPKVHEFYSRALILFIFMKASGHHNSKTVTKQHSHKAF